MTSKALTAKKLCILKHERTIKIGEDKDEMLIREVDLLTANHHSCPRYEAHNIFQTFRILRLNRTVG